MSTVDCNFVWFYVEVGSPVSEQVGGSWRKVTESLHGWGLVKENEAIQKNTVIKQVDSVSQVFETTGTTVAIHRYEIRAIIGVTQTPEENNDICQVTSIEPSAGASDHELFVGSLGRPARDTGFHEHPDSQYN